MVYFRVDLFDTDLPGELQLKLRSNIFNSSALVPATGYLPAVEGPVEL